MKSPTVIATLKERWQANIWLRRIVLLGGGTVVLLLVLGLVDRLGFHLMATNYGLRPERLRDVTFPIWRHEPIAHHGFLVFLTPTDFAAKIAYSNHSTAYLFAMYALSLLTRIWAGLDLRSTSAYVEMIMLLGVLVWQIRKRAKVQLHSLESLLLLGMLAVVATEPGFWISAGKFNVDNPFHFVVPLMLMACYQLAYRERRDRWFWASIVVFAVFAPFPAVLLAVFIGLKMIGGQRYRKRWAAPCGFMLVVGAAFYLQPLVVSRALGFSSSNSGWLFRSGLDGDTRYYSNPLTAIVHPFSARPFYFLAVPGALVALQWLYNRLVHDRSAMLEDNDKDYLQLLLSQYALSALFWPQALSIHPYLYDYLLVAPLLVWATLRFGSGLGYRRHFTFWAFAMVGLVTFNLTQIAQAARCLGCSYTG